MLLRLFSLDQNSKGSLQSKVRERLSQAILDGECEEGVPLPSTRALADHLGISRNTVTIVYQDLVAEGVLVSQGRRGYFIAPNAFTRLPSPDDAPVVDSTVAWNDKLVIRPAGYNNISHPSDWRSKQYTFAYGQHDRWLFPISNWRKVSRESLSLHDMHDWTVDYVDGDDPLILDAFRHRILPRRGFIANLNQILVTVGAQHALQLAAQCLIKPGTVVGVEDPTYPDARNIFRMFGAELRALPVDDQGLIVSNALIGCDVVYVTPSHQSPTTVTMSPERRAQLLDYADHHNFIIIEDDYDTESRFGKTMSSALKSMDRSGRVIYVTSLSKLLSPGLRVGFLVGPEAFMREARALRRLSIRHPAANNQRTVALFLKGGHYETLLHRFHTDYENRWRVLRDAVAQHLPFATISSSEGGSSLWLRLPEGTDTARLAAAAYARDVHIEPGHPHFLQDPPMNFLRLGFSSITAQDIPEGIRRVGIVAAEMGIGSRL